MFQASAFTFGMSLVSWRRKLGLVELVGAYGGRIENPVKIKKNYFFFKKKWKCFSGKNVLFQGIHK